MTLLQEPHYNLAAENSWTGRIDGTDRPLLRWHQLVEYVDLAQPTNLQGAVVIIGFSCDEGVRRNKGRIGAKEAPTVLRKVLANLPVHFSAWLRIVDAGDIHCIDSDLEKAQLALAQAVSIIIKQGGLPIVLGGGHEVTYGHYLGLREATKKDTLGIINLDAHLDIRETVDGVGNSGTGFYQIAEDCAAQGIGFHYLPIGIDKMSNTQALFSYAKQQGVDILYQDKFSAEFVADIMDRIEAFAKRVDHVYLTLDMDVFAAPYAPGVSALAYNGIVPDSLFKTVFSKIAGLPNLRSVDLAELNPKYDIDNRTARLGATLLFDLLAELDTKNSCDDSF